MPWRVRVGDADFVVSMMLLLWSLLLLLLLLLLPEMEIGITESSSKAGSVRGFVYVR